MTKKTWTEFRNTGLLLFINTILHAFGWAIVFDIDSDTGMVNDVYPARTKFRGVGEHEISESYRKLSAYMVENAEALYKESCE
jgi:hypothetical protein